MRKISVVVLGASGFVGKNIVDLLQNDSFVTLFTASRSTSSGEFFFDLLQEDSWTNIFTIQPDIIIDASGYGVVKNQTDLEQMYQVNYLQKRTFVDRLFRESTSTFWIQIGTAFEYSLEAEALTENSLCFPRTHYGISKNLFSVYLTSSYKGKYCILRPFGMFGEREDPSKFFPLLLLAQKNRQKIALSDGSQSRDYVYVKDLSHFILSTIQKGELSKLENQVINIGSGKPKTLRMFSEILAKHVPNFDPTLWNWGAIDQRTNENPIFYNASSKASELGFSCSDLDEAFHTTVNYYYNL
jgi:nucleoside-diphosphate-sugar epimerase